MTARFTRLSILLAVAINSLGWPSQRIAAQNLTSTQQVTDIAVPQGFERTANDSASFAYWLRQLPLKPDTARIHLYDGRLKQYQSANYRVLDLPIGHRDLQQCADAVIRLRSDYLFDHGRWRDIAFNFTSGDRTGFEQWANGWRPSVNGNDVTWHQSHPIDSSRDVYGEYLETVFMYAGSYSLKKEMHEVANIHSIQIGDCFIQGGFPGHVVIVVDMAVDTLSGEKLVLLAQGFTPAQDIHVIRNFDDDHLNPWYAVGRGERLVTPEWTFEWSDLRRFSDEW